MQIFDELDTPIYGFEAGLRQRALETICEVIGEVACNTALAEGRALMFDEAVKYALAS